MSKTISVQKRILLKDLPKYLNKEIIIVHHTNANLNALEFEWFEVPVKVKLLEIKKELHQIVVLKGNNIFNLNMKKIDEIMDN
jgi:nitric oxide synthase oxygenase domain/subunit